MTILSALRPISLALATLTALPAAAAAFDAFGGAATTRGLTADDVRVHRMDDEFYTESWYFMGVNKSDGTQFFVHFGLTNAGPGTFKGAVETTVITADGRIYFAKEAEIDNDDFTWRPDALDMSFNGRHTLSGDTGAWRMTSKDTKAGFDLNVRAHVPGLVFGNGRVTFDDEKEEFYQLAVLSPKTAVTGTLTVDGRTIAVDAWGYADHAWQNYPAHKMADRLFSVRGFSDAQSVAYLSFVVPGGQLIPTLIVTEGDQVTLATHLFTQTETGAEPDGELKNYVLPTAIALAPTAGGPAFKAELNLKRRVQRQDAVADFSAIERMLIKMFVARPILYRHDGAWSVETGGRTLNGSAVVESMILRVN